MSQTRDKQDLEDKAALFKALGHPTRLLLLNLIKMQPRHGEELAAILLLSPATVSHHLAKLVDAGLLESRKDQYYQTYSLIDHALKRRLSDVIFVPQPDLTAQVEEDAYRAKVVDTFFRYGRLVSIPAQLKKRQVILERLAEEFEPDRDYPEREVNLILVEFHDDVATLRRGLIEHKLMERQGGVYRRIPASAE